MPLKPDPTFYPSPASAAEAPAEKLAYVVTLNTGTNGDQRPTRSRSSTSTPGRRATARRSAGSTCPTSATSCTTSAGTPAPARCARGRRTRTSSAATCSCPGLRSLAIHVIDAKDDRSSPSSTKVIEPEELHAPHRLQPPAHRPLRPRRHLRQRAGQPRGDGPGGVFLLDHDDFSRSGRWEIERGPQHLAYDVLVAHRPRHAADQRVGHAEHGRGRHRARALLGNQYGHHLHVWDLRTRRHMQASTSAPSTRWSSSCAPPTTRRKPYGFVGVVVSTADLSASVWLWHRATTAPWASRRSSRSRAEPAEPEPLPPALQPFGAVPPLVTDIALSSTTRTSTSPAGAPASSSATTSPTRAARSRPAACASAASSGARRTRPPGR